MIKENDMIESFEGNDIFKELSSPIRLKIMRNLHNKESTISFLAKIFKTSIPAIQKHTDRLLVSGLIEKQENGTLVLSPTGLATLEQIPFFEFLSKNMNYFQNHSFGNLPVQFIHRLGELSDGEFISNEMQVWEKQRDCIFKTKKFSFGMTTQIPLEAYDIFVNKIKEGIVLRGIVGKNTFAAKGNSKQVKKIGIHNKIPKEKMEWRKMDKIGVFVIATENEGFVSFENKKTKEADLGSTFYSKEPEFCKWCLDVFNYYWDTAKSFDPSQLEER
ncbi:MAG: hypothetical protein OES14_06015 [Nitrosopumilus sp.]|nr:hypothetical protein [Nitrosopumilus sp.]